MKLVLLPGLDGTGVLFEPLLQVLPQALTPVVQSYPGDVPLSYGELLPIAQSALPVSEPFILLGESFSGPLALRIAADNPPGLKGVILCASFVRNPVRFFPRACHRLIQPFIFSSWPPWFRCRALFVGYSSRAMFELVERAHRSVTAEVMAARAREIIAVDAEADLSACRVPLLYIAGARDRLVPEHNRRRIKRIKPSVKVVVLPSSHMVLQNVPEAAAEVIAEFAERVGTE
jgi:pimeloyl-ACP methyl ester carboxylesterase